MGRWDAGLDEPSAWLNCFHSLGEAHLETGSSWSVYIGILGSSTSLARISSPYVWLQVSKGDWEHYWGHSTSEAALPWPLLPMAMEQGPAMPHAAWGSSCSARASR